ncbi:unnamed protein product [Symbiodinium sp. CCMP2592]|nr:unnamed protein product [Symbiodinium sp. CCMP2592]
MARACLAAVIAFSSLAFGLGETCVEEHSLMQQKLAQTEARKAAVSFVQTWQLTTGHPGSHSPESLGELTEGLKKMAKGRKHGSKLDESSSGALEGIQKQMGKIKKDTLDDHHTAIKQLNALYDAITSCEAPSSSKPEAAKNKLEGQHATCRGEEAAALGKREVERVEYEALTSPPQPCFAQFNDGSLGTLQHHDVMMDCAEKIRTWAHTLRQSGPKKKADYEKAAQRYLQKQAQCNGLQRQFESSFCALETSIEDGCESLQNCYSAAVGSWESSKPDFQAMEASRKATFRAAEKVICLVTAMMQTQVLDEDIGACDNLDVDTLPLDLPSFRNAPPQPTCDFSSVSPAPCEKSFVSLYYISQDWYAEAPAETCTPCASGPLMLVPPSGPGPLAPQSGPSSDATSSEANNNSPLGPSSGPGGPSSVAP